MIQKTQANVQNNSKLKQYRIKNKIQMACVYPEKSGCGESIKELP